MDKLELLKKIKALADSGLGGEKQNAQQLLEKLMKQYRITERDISDEKLNTYSVKWKGFKEKELLNQIFYSVVGNVNSEKKFYTFVYSKAKKGEVKCTASEFIEFQAKYNFYVFHLREDLEMFYKAFIQTNNIFPPSGKIKAKDEDKKQLTEEDMKMLMLAENLEKHHFRKQLEG